MYIDICYNSACVLTFCILFLIIVFELKKFDFYVAYFLVTLHQLLYKCVDLCFHNTNMNKIGP